MKREFMLLVIVFALFFQTPAQAKSKGPRIEGFVGQSSTVPASGVTVKLMDSTGRVLDMDDTNFFGKYRFNGVAPGYYIVQVNNIRREVLVKKGDKKKRLDIDLSSATGAMNYSQLPSPQQPPPTNQQTAPKPGGGFGSAPQQGGGLGQPQASGGGFGSAPQQGGGLGQPQASVGGFGSASQQGGGGIMQQMAARYYGFQGSTETKAALCPNGVYYDASESGYSGQSHNSLGNETMAWGTAGQNQGQGRWTAQGTVQQGVITITYNDGSVTRVNYRAIDNQGCYNFNSTTMCRQGPANCQ
jgi:hypothetical protein